MSVRFKFGMLGCRQFYQACHAPAWQVEIRDAGHFQFLDQQSAVQKAVCTTGSQPDTGVRLASQVRSSMVESLSAGVIVHHALSGVPFLYTCPSACDAGVA